MFHDFNDKILFLFISFFLLEHLLDYYPGASQEVTVLYSFSSPIYTKTTIIVKSIIFEHEQV